MKLSQACFLENHYNKAVVDMPDLIPIDFDRVLVALGMSSRSHEKQGLLVQGPKSGRGTSVCHVSRAEAIVKDQTIIYRPTGGQWWPNVNVNIPDDSFSWYSNTMPLKCRGGSYYDGIRTYWVWKWKMTVDYDHAVISEPMRGDSAPDAGPRWCYCRTIRVPVICDVARNTDAKSLADDNYNQHYTVVDNFYTITWWNYPGNPNGFPAGSPRDLPYKTWDGPCEHFYRRNTRPDVPEINLPYRLAFQLGEDRQFMPYLSKKENAWSAFHQQQKSNAFLNACEGFPQLNSNSWANILEIISTLRKISKGDLVGAIDVPKKWYNAWLQYRYRYNTTRADIRDLKEFVSSVPDWRRALNGMRKTVYGTYASNGQLWRCEVTAQPRVVSQLQSIFSAIDRIGFGLTLYNLWDMIPYSFVVDWIFPVGDLLEQLHQNEKIITEYSFEEICYSVTYERDVALHSQDVGDFSATVYDRWYESVPPSLNNYYWISDDPSTKTCLMRIIDGVSLLVGNHK